MELVQREAESGAVGTGFQGAGLRNEGQLLHHGARALGAHEAADHLDVQENVTQRLA